MLMEDKLSIKAFTIASCGSAVGSRRRFDLVKAGPCTSLGDVSLYNDGQMKMYKYACT